MCREAPGARFQRYGLVVKEEKERPLKITTCPESHALLLEELKWMIFGKAELCPLGFLCLSCSGTLKIWGTYDLCLLQL